jgi:hypothetical protein
MKGRSMEMVKGSRCATRLFVHCDGVFRRGKAVRGPKTGPDQVRKSLFFLPVDEVLSERASCPQMR